MTASQCAKSSNDSSQWNVPAVLVGLGAAGLGAIDEAWPVGDETARLALVDRVLRSVEFMLTVKPCDN